jgi:glutamyl/glutaminyl-tRNA synthetase
VADSAGRTINSTKGKGSSRPVREWQAGFPLPQSHRVPKEDLEPFYASDYFARSSTTRELINKGLAYVCDFRQRITRLSRLAGPAER